MKRQPALYLRLEIQDKYMESAIKEEVPWSSDSEKQKMCPAWLQTGSCIWLCNSLVTQNSGPDSERWHLFNHCPTHPFLNRHLLAWSEDTVFPSSDHQEKRRDLRGTAVPCVTRPPLTPADAPRGFGSEQGSDSSCPALKNLQHLWNIYMFAVCVYMCVSVTDYTVAFYAYIKGYTYM